jgi:ketosteroid isomerase-like protein
MLLAHPSDRVRLMNMNDLESWTDAYILAWASNDPKAIGDLFTEDARYFTHPFREPWKGREEIVRQWTEHPDPPGSWKASYRPLALNGNTGVIRGTTQYFKKDGSLQTEFANIYVIEFADDGRAAEFTEWFMEASPPARD